VEMERLKVSDVVIIKSGSPKMVISKIGIKKSGFEDNKKCVCEYFNDGILKSMTVSIDTLIKN